MTTEVELEVSKTVDRPIYNYSLRLRDGRLPSQRAPLNKSYKLAGLTADSTSPTEATLRKIISTESTKNGILKNPLLLRRAPRR